MLQNGYYLINFWVWLNSYDHFNGLGRVFQRFLKGVGMIRILRIILMFDTTIITVFFGGVSLYYFFDGQSDMAYQGSMYGLLAVYFLTLGREKGGPPSLHD